MLLESFRDRADRYWRGHFAMTDGDPTAQPVAPPTRDWGERARRPIVRIVAATVISGVALLTVVIPDRTDGREPEPAGPVSRPTVAPGSSAPPAGYPDASSTGVPDGITLRPSGSLTIAEDGAVIDGLHVTGTITVTADDVIIRNTKITNTGYYAVRIKDASGLVIEDSEIDGQSTGGAAVAFRGYTLRRVHIHHVAEGPRISGDEVTIEDSYIHALVQVGDNHTDVVQIVGGRDIVISGNTLDAYNRETGSLGNAAVQMGEEEKPVRDCLIEGNYLNGGNYTVNAGGGGNEGAECTIRDNVVGRDARYGAQAFLGPRIVWESNTWLDTGEVVDRETD
jgi:hypothetical protein